LADRLNGNFLEGEHSVLEPLTLAHVPSLCQAAADGELWNLWYTSVPKPEQMPAYVQQALDAEQQGCAMPFVVRDAVSGEIIGTSRFCNWDRPNRRLEIGYTWYARRAQRTAINTETKLLMLSHAFDTHGVMAVEFRTHWHNQVSRRAIARLGAKQDGVLRNHQLLEDGSIRDTVVFSILDSEWPAVRRGLMFRLAQGKQNQ
jgi:N-acetyltransferase